MDLGVELDPVVTLGAAGRRGSDARRRWIDSGVMETQAVGSCQASLLGVSRLLKVIREHGLFYFPNNCRTVTIFITSLRGLSRTG